MQQLEQVEWDDVNKLLQHHGFKPVFFADPVENKNLTDLVLLDKKSAGELRTTLRMMLTDSERRQALIQELVMSNNQLKEEVQKHMTRAAQQSQKVTELEGLLDEVKTRVQDLEDHYLGKAVQQLPYEHKERQKCCQLLEQKLLKQKEETVQLQRKLYFTIKEEEQRLAQQSQTFQRICKKAFKQSSAADKQSAKGEVKGSKTKKTSIATPSFKTIFKEYQEQQKRSDFQIKELKREVDCLKQELDTRLPKDVISSERNKNTTDQFRDARLCVHYHQLLTEISTLVTNPNAPLGLRSKLSTNGLEQADFQALLQILEEWAQQLQLLKDLQRSINKLSVRLMPWQPSDGDVAEALKVEDMMLLVDTLLENISADDQQLRSPTRYTLESMVSHFQKLFDVSSISGVYPRMNEVYTRLGEMTNAMRNLRDILGLDSRVSPAEVVNQVARLVSLDEHDGGVHNLLGEADIDSIIIKVRQHDEFFPAFHVLVTEMLNILGVSHLDDILPALKSLKQTTQ
ncbi:centrosomal protein of 70 kDa isoform X2 [Kryptolebias marmoratus]|uniref:centrosomal protein of 70 kDa isoform X2 n=1 Tax=Kryptolebias marmoratus TaxID=37003 RepID=UPI000D530766|nr:centrosomal protein of 70 kDa isoform X2 [Kryptolebias marmoratus]